MHKTLNHLSITLVLFLFPLMAESCTLAFSNDNLRAKTVARSMDLYMSDQPTLMVFPQGVQHKSDSSKNPLTWTARYGTVVITAFHSNAVSAGINEHGLSAHLLYLDKSNYDETDDARPTLSNVQWAQYMLDNFKTVNEALSSMNQVRIVATKINGRTWPIHLSLQDSTGDSAIIEFIDGKAVVHHGKEYNVMTNEPAYTEQLSNLKRYKLFGGNLPMPGDIDSLSRFVRAASYLKTLPKPQTDVEALAGITSVIRTTMVPFGAEDTSGNEMLDAWPTRWITLSDLTHKTFYFSATQAPNIVWVDLSKLQFTPGLPVLSLDPLRIDLVGDVSDALKAVAH